MRQSLENLCSHGPFFVNCSAAVSLIFLSRYLMRGCSFESVGCLALLHMVSTGAVAWSGAQHQVASSSVLLREKLFFAFVSNMSLISMNLSLSFNSVGTYQISKILMIPTCALLEYLVDGKTVTTRGVAAMAVVMFGVGLATVSDVAANSAGLIAAFSGVVSASGTNVACSHISKKYNISASEFIMKTLPLQLGAMFAFGPVFDTFVRGDQPWVWVRNSNRACLFVIFLSCLLAAAVNISLVSCVKRYDASGFQILSHTKTVVVLCIGWASSNGANLIRQVFGACIAICGMILYSNSVTADRKEATVEPEVSEKHREEG